MAQSNSNNSSSNESAAVTENRARAEEIIAAGKQRYAAMQARVPVLDKTLQNLCEDFSEWTRTMTKNFAQHGQRSKEICASACEQERELNGMLNELASLHSHNDIEMKQFAASVHYKQETISILQEKSTKKNAEMRELDNTIASNREKCAQRRKRTSHTYLYLHNI